MNDSGRSAAVLIDVGGEVKDGVARTGSVASSGVSVSRVLLDLGIPLG